MHAIQHILLLKEITQLLSMDTFTVAFPLIHAFCIFEADFDVGFFCMQMVPATPVFLLAFMPVTPFRWAAWKTQTFLRTSLYSLFQGQGCVLGPAVCMSVTGAFHQAVDHPKGALDWDQVWDLPFSQNTRQRCNQLLPQVRLCSEGGREISAPPSLEGGLMVGSVLCPAAYYMCLEPLLQPTVLWNELCNLSPRGGL